MPHLRISVCVFIAFCCVAALCEEKKPESGEWTIKLTPKANNTIDHTDKPYDDVLTIKDGKIISKVCSQYQFDPAPYAAAAGKGEMTADMKSAKHGKAVWTFQVTGEKIEGTFNWDKAGKKASFTFTGSKKAEDKK